MAPKKGSHVPGQTQLQSANLGETTPALEKKLRPIYDCLDFGNYKKALQESERILKKFKDSTCAKALKVLALIRLGRLEDAQPLIKEVHDRKPSDESTLQVMTICYKELNKLDKIAEMYESAVEQCPGSEEYLTHLFMAHVRLGNYKRQQQIAVILHKLKPNNHPYYYWSVMSIVMQAVTADESVAQSILLPLAEKMASKKRQNLTTVESNAEVVLLLDIFEKQEKYAQAFELMNGEMGELLVMDYVTKTMKKAELLLKADRVANANEINKEILLTHPDNWQTYLDYFTTSFQLIDSRWTPEDGSDSQATHSVEGVLEFIAQQNELNIASVQPQRGPLLAKLELSWQLYKRQTYSLKDVQDRIIEYCESYGKKQCCYRDIHNYFEDVISSITDEENDCISLDDFMKRLATVLDIETKNELCSENISHYTEKKSMQGHILFIQLQRLIGHHNYTSTEKLKDLAVTLQAWYIHAAKTVEHEAPVTDVKVCDTYLLLAVHSLMDAYELSKDTHYCIQALSMLEEGYELSQANHHIILLLIYIYCDLGVYGPIPKLVTTIDVKHVLYGPLGYLYSGQSMTCGYVSAASQQYTEMLKHYTGAQREISDSLIACYRYGTFSKVEEFVNYKTRVQNSIQHAAALTQRLVLDLILGTKNYESVKNAVTLMEDMPVVDGIQWDKLRDNRDVPLALSWLSKDKTFSDEMRQHTFAEEKAWVKLQYLSVRLTATAVYLAEGSSNGTSQLPSLLTRLLDEYKQHIEYCNTHFATAAQVPRFTTHNTRLISQLQSGQVQAFLSLPEIIASLIQLDKNEVHDKPSICELMKKSLDHITALCTDLSTDSIIQSEKLVYTSCSQLIEGLVNTSELLSFAVVFMGACWKLLAPARQPVRKKKKGRTESDVPEAMVTAMTTLRQVNKQLKELIKETIGKSTTLKDLAVTENMSDLQLEEKESNRSVRNTIHHSYSKSAEELIELLECKLILLDGLS